MTPFIGSAPTTALAKALEGGAIVHYGGLYYAIGSHLTGWMPNPDEYATAKTLAGPWTQFHGIAPAAAKTYGSQSTFLLKVTGSEETAVIFMGDEWKPHDLGDSRYLWMPVRIGNGHFELPAPRPWTIDVPRGRTLVQ